MTTITIDNIYTLLSGTDKEIDNAIWEKLSYEIREFKAEYIQVRHLYNRKTHKTYTGLLPYVIEILNDMDEEYTINDLRNKPQSNADYNLLPEFIPRDYQQDIIDDCTNREVIRVATGGGKCLPLDTPILTPNGFIPMKDIHVGDIVYDEDGCETTVIGEYPQGELQEYEIIFNDGTSIKCCKDHLWKFATKDNLTNNKWQVKTTEEILNNFNIKSGRSYNLSIPNCKPIQFNKQNLFLPPYLLGALLGDGGFSQNQITFTNIEEDIINKVQELASQFGGIFKKFKSHKIQYTYVCGRYQDNPLKDYLYNTFGKITSEKKFIPTEYKYSSIEDRIALLQGLFDTDGHINTKGHIRYTTVSKQLADDVVFVLNSLGYRAKILYCERHRDRFERPTYNIDVRGCDDKLFTSIKHQTNFTNRQIPKKQHHYDVMKITSIKALQTKSEMKCIAVDSPKHTYICKDFIVTHNTFIMAGIIAKFKTKPVAIFADKLSLCTQLQSEISKFLGEEVGLVGGGVNDKKDITVYSVQSATEDDVKDANVVLFDECFPADAKVNIGNAEYKTIKEIVDNKLDIKIPSFNTVTQQVEYKKIINWGKKPNTEKFYEITIMDDNGEKHTIVCTENHKIYVNNEYVKAKDVQLNDEVIILNEKTIDNK